MQWEAVVVCGRSAPTPVKLRGKATSTPSARSARECTAARFARCHPETGFLRGAVRGLGRLPTRVIDSDGERGSEQAAASWGDPAPQDGGYRIPGVVPGR